MKTTPIQWAPIAPQRARKHRPPALIIASVAVILLALFLAAFGSMLAPDANHQDLADSMLPPGSPGHLLGTDQLGRDTLQLAIAGTRTAIIGPIVIALGSSVLGVLLGTLAGYRRGWVDALVSRWADLLLALPVVLVALVVVGILGSGYWLSIALLVLLFSPSDTRIVRSVVLEEASRPYIESARVAGIGSTRIMFVHILPNVLRMAVTNLLLNTAFALVALSSLSFLGLGIAPGTPDWGRQLADGWTIMAGNPAAVITPALLIIVVACAINLFGDWLSERFEERGNR
ncbi:MULTISPECIES: ABC transporter permease [unclassified Leucobacter]|uniref:ABC transporter permease n=1 Tax=unclassified Leucobacter TaxID=2621730 RepID=UPI00165D97E0|nr:MULTISPECIES: ABC transporter permease [unclassified Leucobacter]MBC9936016.1 ABC transporter permease [Leucobacter sp. cx-87]